MLVDLVASTGSMDVKALALQALTRCIQPGSAGQREAVAAGKAIPLMVTLFGPSSGGRVRELAAHVLALLCFLPEGKPAAVDAGAVPALLTLMQDRSADVRAEAVAACMAIVVDNKGKSAFVAAGFQPLLKLLKDPSKLVRLNTLRAVTVLCANVEARDAVKGSGAVADIRPLAESGDRVEADIAAKALAVVEWTA